MEFSVYLVGTYERRLGVGTVFQIVNPTVNTLYVVAAVFTPDGVFQAVLHKRELRPNALWEVNLARKIDGLTADHGVVKFFSLDVHSKELKPGIVGFQRQVLIIPDKSEAAFSESELVAVPREFADPDFEVQVRPRI